MLSVSMNTATVGMFQKVIQNFWDVENLKASKKLTIAATRILSEFFSPGHVLHENILLVEFLLKPCRTKTMKQILLKVLAPALA